MNIRRDTLKPKSNPLRLIGWWRGSALLVILIVVAVLGANRRPPSPTPEIALMIGEPWETMRQRSSAAIDPAIPGHAWGRYPKSDARLRLADPQYGFVTPPARYFAVGFEEDKVTDVRMSPQIEPLPLDEALKIVLDLQDQWRAGGWKQIRIDENPPFADTPQWQAQLRNVNKGGVVYWHAGDKYEAMLVLTRFKDDRHSQRRALSHHTHAFEAVDDPLNVCPGKSLPSRT